MKKGSLPSVKEAKEILKKAGKYVGYGALVGAIAATVGCSKIDTEKYNNPNAITKGIIESTAKSEMIKPDMYINDYGNTVELKDGTEISYEHWPARRGENPTTEMERITIARPNGDVEEYGRGGMPVEVNDEGRLFNKRSKEHGSSGGWLEKTKDMSDKEFDKKFKELKEKYSNQE